MQVQPGKGGGGRGETGEANCKYNVVERYNCTCIVVPEVESS